MSGSRRRDYAPTGVLVPGSTVRVYRRDCPGEARPLKVTVRPRGHGERTEAFERAAARRDEATKLDAAVLAGEPFDAGSFRPQSWGAPATVAEPEQVVGVLDYLIAGEWLRLQAIPLTVVLALRQQAASGRSSAGPADWLRYRPRS